MCSVSVADVSRALSLSPRNFCHDVFDLCVFSGPYVSFSIFVCATYHTLFILSPLSVERVFAALICAALLFAARVNNSSADNPFP